MLRIPPLAPRTRTGPELTSPSPRASLNRLDDTALVARCLDDDDAAWSTLVRRYRALVYSTALRTGLDDESAADVFQQVWLELHRSMERLRDAVALPQWLIVTTRRVAYKTALKHDRPIEGVLDELVDPSGLPGDEFADLQSLQHLREHIEALGGSCARLLPLLFLDESEPDYAEIAARAGVAVGSIGPLRARCLGRLRRRLTEES